MNKIILTFIITLNIFAQDAILFIDVNKQPLEIEAARRGAQKVGKTLIVFPDPLSTNNWNPVNSSAVKSFMQNKRFESVIVSGHDGGGKFTGLNGSINRDELVDAIKANPYAKENVDQLMLLGCFTGVRSEMNQWKGGLPNVKLIAGYEGASPLGHRETGHTFIEDIIEKSEEIINQTNQNEIQSILKNEIRNMQHLSSAIYVEAPMCTQASGNEFYYRQLNDEQFTLFRNFECRAASDDFYQNYYPNYQKYFSGELPIPHNISGTELRSIYHFIMQNIECVSDAIDETNSALMLLFFHEFKKNAVNYYSGLIQDMNNIKNKYLNEPPRTLVAGKISELEGQIAKLEADKLNKNPLVQKALTYSQEASRKMAAIGLTSAEINLVQRTARNEVVDFSHINETRMIKIREYFRLYYKVFKVQESLKPDILDSKIKEKIDNLKTELKFQNDMLKLTDETLNAWLKDDKDNLHALKLPTAENIDSMTRKDVVDLANKIHAINPLILTKKESETLMIYQDVINQSFYQMQEMPMEWFEEVHDIKNSNPLHLSNKFIDEEIKTRSDIELDLLIH